MRAGDQDAIFMLQRSIKNARDRVDLDEAVAVLEQLGVAVD